MNIEDKIIELEKEALNEWSNGNPAGYMARGSEEFTYFDNLGARELVIGIENMRKYGEDTFSNLPVHKYQMAGAHVQHYDNTAILGYQYHPFSLEGEPLTKWSATVVYLNKGGNWKTVHAHWTMLQEEAN